MFSAKSEYFEIPMAAPGDHYDPLDFNTSIAKIDSRMKTIQDEAGDVKQTELLDLQAQLTEVDTRSTTNAGHIITLQNKLNEMIESGSGSAAEITALQAAIDSMRTDITNAGNVASAANSTATAASNTAANALAKATANEQAIAGLGSGGSGNVKITTLMAQNNGVYINHTFLAYVVSGALVCVLPFSWMIFSGSSIAEGTLLFTADLEVEVASSYETNTPTVCVLSQGSSIGGATYNFGMNVRSTRKNDNTITLDMYKAGSGILPYSNTRATTLGFML